MHLCRVSTNLNTCESSNVYAEARLLHSLPHCNTLQHTAAHCSTQQRRRCADALVQHIATHCRILQHAATQCNTLHWQRRAADEFFSACKRVCTSQLRVAVQEGLEDEVQELVEQGGLTFPLSFSFCLLSFFLFLFLCLFLFLSLPVSLSLGPFLSPSQKVL